MWYGKNDDNDDLPVNRDIDDVRMKDRWAGETSAKKKVNKKEDDDINMSSMWG